MLIEAPELSALPGIRHAFFTREGGASEGIYASLNGGLGSSDRPERVAENRIRMAGRIGVTPDRLLSLYQVHSPDVVVAREPWTTESRPRADAMVTNRPGLALGVSHADCGPALFADPVARVIGAAHAGWKGALAGVLEATIARMEEFGARRERIVVCLGPTIGPRHYEVGPEFEERFGRESPGSAAFFREDESRVFFDLPAFILSRLRAAGLIQCRSLDLCTYADEARFFSYRRTTHRAEGDYGRLISAIAISAS